MDSSATEDGLQEHAQSGLGASFMRSVRSTAGTVAQHSTVHRADSPANVDPLLTAGPART